MLENKENKEKIKLLDKQIHIVRLTGITKIIRYAIERAVEPNVDVSKLGKECLKLLEQIYPVEDNKC